MTPGAPDTPEADAAGLLEALRGCGLLSDGEAARLTPLAGGVSSDVFRVDTAGGRTLAVKRSIGQLRVKADWRAPVERVAGEVRWLELVRGIDPRLAPEVLAEVPKAFMFAMAFLEPADYPVWKTQMAEGHVDPAFAAAVGADLARIHAATAHRPDVAQAFPTGDYFFALRTAPFLLFTAERHPDVAPRLRALADDLSGRRVALMHGDISPKNILAGPDGPVFIDAECVAYGDPAFDLAFCLTHLLLKTIWLAPNARPLMTAFAALADAYAAGVGWECWAGLSSRAAGLVSGLLLARVDGKSPAPYLTAEADKGRVRRAAKTLLGEEGLDLAALARRWEALVDL